MYKSIIFPKDVIKIMSYNNSNINISKIAVIAGGVSDVVMVLYGLVLSSGLVSLMGLGSSNEASIFIVPLVIPGCLAT